MKNKALILLAGLLLLTSCRASDRASTNISREADEFRVYRRVVFYNGITDEYILEVTGYCAIAGGKDKGELSVTCEVTPGKYQKHFLGLSDNVTYTVEQLDDSNVSDTRYKFIFKPEMIIPIEVQVGK